MDFLPLDDRPIMVIVGPEGGISPEELGALNDAGAGSYRLGQPVLRTSTAGPAALAVLSGVLGRW
jgi:16S rRNA (uracil1498-N3)-methyltransferase